MFTTRVVATVLQGRLDSGFYEPAEYEFELRVRGLSIPVAQLGSFAAEGTSITYGIVQPGRFVSPGQGVRLVRCVDIDREMSVKADELLWVSHEIANPYARSDVKPRDVLIGIAGTLGCIGLAPQGIEPANLNQSVARLRVDERSGTQPEWVATYLATRFGQAILLRRSVGSVQQHLNLADLPEVPVLLPHPNAQAYIGDKVRQAERLRARAALSLRFATNLVAMLIDREVSEDDIKEGMFSVSAVASSRHHDDVPRRRHTRASTGELTDRIDAWYYQPHLVAAYRKIEQSGNCKPLADVIDEDRDVKGGATPLGAEYLQTGPVRFIRTSDVWGLAVHNEDTVFITGEQDQALTRSKLADGDVLLTITGADFGHAGVVTSRQLPANISQHTVRFRPTIDPSYLVAYLESSYGQIVIWRQAYGATRPAIDYPGVKGLLIRVPDPAAQKVVGDAVRTGVAARELAHSLTLAAKLLVEGLIDGHVTESDLQAAHADRDSDRAILRRLTAKGLDVAGEPPLFPDLDQLEAALADAGGPTP